MAHSNWSAEKTDFWRSALQRQPHSGLTVKDFCQSIGVSVPSFYAWKKKLNAQPQDSSDELVPVTVLAANASSPHPIEIVTPTGFTLRVAATIDRRQLAELIDAVEAATTPAC